MKTRFHTILSLVFIFFAVSCKGTKDVVAVEENNRLVSPIESMYKMQNTVIPKAVIYKTNGDYNNNVIITVNSKGDKVITYPAPTDVSQRSVPIALGDGWLLDCRGGINKDTRFLTYTYSEYSKLSKVPTEKQLLESVIPQARVIDVKVLPVTINEAMSDPSALKKYIE